MDLSFEFDCFGAPGVVTGVRRLLDGNSSAEAWFVARCESDGTLIREFERIVVHRSDLWIGGRSLASVLQVDRGPMAPTEHAEHHVHQDYWSGHWLLPSYWPQELEYAAAQLSSYLFWRAALHRASVFRVRGFGESSPPLLQTPAHRRAWYAVTANSKVAAAVNAAAVCDELAGERSLSPSEALRAMEEAAQARADVTIGETRYRAEFWPGQLPTLTVQGSIAT